MKNFEDYLSIIGLEYLIPEIEKTKLNNIVEEAFAEKHKKFSSKEIQNLYTYFVPKLSPDGSCSIIDDLDPLPYNVAETFGLEYDIDVLQHHPQTFRLWHLKRIIEQLQKTTAVDWLGIYRKVKNPKHELVLVKESYYGIPSRAEFPLTKEFAKKSNNSTVGLTGKAIVIQSVSKHEGAYYKCDGKVQSEFCLPILSSRAQSRDLTQQSSKSSVSKISPLTSFGRNDSFEVIGIIDAEAFPENFFSKERLLQISKVAYDLGKINMCMTTTS